MTPALPLALALLWPVPREMTVLPETRLRLPTQVVAKPEVAGPAGLLRRELVGLFGPAACTGKPATIITIELSPRELTRPEEYSLGPTKAGIRLRAHDVQGMYWGVHTLATLLSHSRRTRDGYLATIPRLRDWPDTPHRAFMIQGAWTPDAEELKRNLRVLARMRVAYFALEFGPQVVLDFDPGIARGGRFGKAQAADIIAYGRSLGLKPIAYLNMLGHLERAYQKEPYTLHGGIDIRSDESYDRFVYPILSEMLEVYGPIETFHCGMDEAWELCSWLSAEGYDVSSLVARHITRVSDFLKARGVKLVIWHDMIIAPQLADELGAPVGPANGGPPQNTAAALDAIPRDVILNYWFYDPVAQYPALDYLRGKGFTVWASPWQTPFSLVRYAQARQVPTLGTIWTGPPEALAASNYSPITAYYAQAAWRAAAAPAGVNPEPALTQAAQRATSALVWGRRRLTLPGRTALSLTPHGPSPLSWPDTKTEQYYGVPLQTDAPVRIAPLPSASKPLDEDSRAATVLLPGEVTLPLDGVNAPRAENQLILFTAPRQRSGTNLYGVEVMVAADGTVLETVGYGSGDHAIPAGGFILSAHLGPDPVKGRHLEALRPGQRVAVLDTQGQWLGGSQPRQAMPEAELQAALAERTRTYPVNAPCQALYLAMSADTVTAPETAMGQWIIEYADGARETMPVRYGREVVAPTVDSLPARTDDPVFLIEQPHLRCLVREWPNPRPQAPIRQLVFEPAPPSLDLGLTAHAVVAVQ